MIIEEFEDDYSNFFYNNTNTNNNKTGIFDRPHSKHVFTNTLQDDVNEYLHVLNINKNHQTNEITINKNHIQNSSESVIKKPLLTDMVNIPNLKSQQFDYKSNHLLLKDDLFNIKNDPNFIFLSPESDIDTATLLLNDLNTKKSLTNSSKSPSFRKQDYLTRYRYIVPVEKFYSYNDDELGNGRPKTAKKLIDSPKTENTETSDLTNLELLSEKEYTHLPDDSNGGSEHQETDNKSMWILKVQLWIDKLKNKKQNKKKLVKNKKLNSSSKLETFDVSNDKANLFSSTFKDMNEYSKFFINEPSNSVGNSLALKHTPKNSTNMILRQTEFDDMMIKIHHQHYLFLNFVSPINCAFCLKYIRENNLEEELKTARYFSLYESDNDELDNDIVDYHGLSDGKVYESSLFNLWHGIKREISFKLKKSDSKSIKTIGSLKSPKKSYISNGHNKPPQVIGQEEYNNPKLCTPLSQRELKKLTKMLLRNFKNLDVVKTNITRYPMLKDKANQTKNKDIILLMTDELFEKKLSLWNQWFWKTLSNESIDFDSYDIRCNKCDTKLLSSMENILFRYKHSSYKSRVCQTCQVAIDDATVYVESKDEHKEILVKGESDETLLATVESHLEDEHYFEVEGFDDVVDSMQGRREMYVNSG